MSVNTIGAQAISAPSLLLVEDDDTLRYVIERSFLKRGFQVTAVGSFEAAEVAIKHLNTNAAIAAIFDLKLKNTLSLPLIGQLLLAIPNAKILMLTGYASIATAVEAVKLGATNYLPKPASIDDIFAALDLNGSGPIAPQKDIPQSNHSNTTIVSTQRLEWEHIQRVLLNNNGNISAAARELNMHRRTLQRKLQKYPHKR